MIRGLLKGLLASVGGIVILGFSIYLGVENKSWMVFLFSLAAGIWLTYHVASGIDKAGRIDMNEWLSSVAECDYKYAWDGSGIALDATGKQIHLTGRTDKKSVSKTYSFYDVREWGFEIPGVTMETGTTFHGPSLHAVSKNLGNIIGTSMVNQAILANAEDNTGLWLAVRDIDFPKWFIKFGAEKGRKHTETELNRWMEILRQNINQD